MEPDDTMAALRKALEALLMGSPPEKALAPLPEELRALVLAALEGD
jgi:hypothetical protein